MDVTADHAAGDAAATLDAVATAYWDAYLEANPEFATAIGDARFDDILEDPTPEGAAATRARYTDILARASRIDPDALDAHGRITLAALRESAGSDIAQIDTGLDDWNLDPLEGVPASFLLIPDYQRLETAEDGRRMLARWRAMATCTDRHLDSVRRSLADGRVACVAPGVRTVRILEELLHGDTADWPLLAPLDDLEDLDDASGWSIADRERFATELAEVVDGEIRPAFVRLHDALVSEIRPLARSSSEPASATSTAARRLPRRSASTRRSTSTPRHPQIGLAEIARIDAEIAALAGATIGAAGLAQTPCAHLRNDPRLYFSTRDEVFERPPRALARANEAMPDWFGRLPGRRVRRRPMRSHEEEHSTIAYYRGRRWTARGPASTTSTSTHPRPGRATRPRRSRTTRPCPATTSRSRSPRSCRTCRRSGAPRIDGVRRGLGPVHRAPVRRDGPLRRRPRPVRDPVVRRVAGRRLVVDTGMHALGWTREPGDPVHARSHGPRARTTSRTRSTGTS